MNKTIQNKRRCGVNKVFKTTIVTILTAILLLVSIPFGFAQQKITVEKVDSIEQSATLPSTTQSLHKILSDPNQIRISENYGSIKETWVPENIIGKDHPLIIHVQDAHCNYEAQANINNIIDGLMKEYPDQVKLVAVEGSVGTIDTSPFAEFSDDEIKKEVADYFMRKGKITGPEFLSITGDHNFTIYGIENKDLYDRNLKAFLDSLPFRNESEKYCGYLVSILSKIKHYVYTDELKEFDKCLNDYQVGDTSFLDYTNILKEWSEKKNVDLADFNNFLLLLNAQKQEEAIDFDVVDKERTRLIDRLGSILEKQELSDLVLKSLHFRLGKLTAAEYYSYLEYLVEQIPDKDKISYEDYPNLFSYIDYVQLHEMMDKTELFDECSQIESLIAEKMFKDNNQRKLYGLSKNLDILRKMFKLELVKDDYLYYKNHKDDFKIKSFIDFIKVQAPRYGIRFYEEPTLVKIDENLPIIEEFYEVAIIRDPVLIDNMLTEMEKKGLNMCVLITGGFHTKGVTEILKERDLAYTVISPRITKKQEDNPYIDIMTNKKTPFEEFLEQLGE